MTEWICIRAEFPTKPEDWSPAISAFEEHGCPGVLETDDPPALTAYLVANGSGQKQAETLAHVLYRLGAHRVDISTVPDEDWSEVWKQHFKPIRIGPRIVVRPTWEPFDPKPDDLPISLDPGQAFGTGDHPTTRMCLEALQELPLLGKRVLDVGCGSGILSMAAALLGAAQVLGTDIDPVAVDVARANIDRELSPLAANTPHPYRLIEFVVCDGLESLQERGRWDVVVSNIISATLIRLAPDVAEVVEPGGAWVTSGVILDNWPDMLAAAESVGFVLEELRKAGDWTCARFRMPEARAQR
ncbi:MAG: 50S ribosomal protein L11 methyltransferase [Fimbriimonadaceae bacterium]